MSADPMEIMLRKLRLERLEGRLCPICEERGETRPLRYNGCFLYCLALNSHSWSNPDAAESVIAEQRPSSATEQARFRSEKVLRDSAECGRLLERLEEVIGPWLPPEARRDEDEVWEHTIEPRGSDGKSKLCKGTGGRISHQARARISGVRGHQVRRKSGRL